MDETKGDRLRDKSFAELVDRVFRMEGIASVERINELALRHWLPLANRPNRSQRQSVRALQRCQNRYG